MKSIPASNRAGQPVTAKTKAYNAKPFRVVAAFVPLLKNLWKRSWKFGANDFLPNEMLALVMDSMTAMNCWARLTEFTEADGFANKASADLLVNATQTANEILRQICETECMFDGFALKIDRNAGGKVAAIYWIPFAKLRKMMDGSFVYNEMLGTRYKVESQNEFFPAFKGIDKPQLDLDPEKAAKKKYAGSEILFCYQENEFNPHYPVARWWAGDQLVKAEASIGQMLYEQVENSFMPSAIISFARDYDDKTGQNEDGTGPTEYEELLEELSEFTGKGGRYGILTLFADSKDQLPEVTHFDNSHVAEAAQTTSDLVDKKVARAWNVPPVLIGIETPGKLGNNEQLQNEIQIFNLRIKKTKNKIERVFKVLYPDKEWTISTLNLFSYIPEQVWGTLQPDQVVALMKDVYNIAIPASKMLPSTKKQGGNND